jgi:hypothetical protein
MNAPKVSNALRGGNPNAQAAVRFAGYAAGRLSRNTVHPFRESATTTDPP